MFEVKRSSDIWCFLGKRRKTDSNTSKIWHYLSLLLIQSENSQQLLMLLCAKAKQGNGV